MTLNRNRLFIKALFTLPNFEKWNISHEHVFVKQFNVQLLLDQKSFPGIGRNVRGHEKTSRVETVFPASLLYKNDKCLPNKNVLYDFIIHCFENGYENGYNFFQHLSPEARKPGLTQPVSAVTEARKHEILDSTKIGIVLTE